MNPSKLSIILDVDSEFNILICPIVDNLLVVTAFEQLLSGCSAVW